MSYLTESSLSTVLLLICCAQPSTEIYFIQVQRLKNVWNFIKMTDFMQLTYLEQRAEANRMIAQLTAQRLDSCEAFDQACGKAIKIWETILHEVEAKGNLPK